MDILRIKKEHDDGEITIEYNDLISNQVLSLETPKIEPKPANRIIKSEDKLLQKNVKVEAEKSNDPKITVVAIEPLPKSSTISCNTSVTKVISKKATLSTNEVQKRKTTVANNNLNVLKNNQTQPCVNTFTSISHNKLSSSDYTRPVHSLPFNGATFLHTQVRSNSVLQTLLKDIVSMNNEKDHVDEDSLNKEIAKLRSKNNLPSLNAEVSNNLELDDSDYSDGSEDESSSYYDSKSSENYGKDSGYDNESQYSESIEDDNANETQSNEGNDIEKSLVIVEPEYIDLDNYYDSKKRKPEDLRNSQSDVKIIPMVVTNMPTSSSKKTNELTVLHSNKKLKTKKAYRQHTPNNTPHFKNLPHKTRRKNNTDKVTTTEENLAAEKGSLKYIRKCDLYVSKKELVKHMQEKRSTRHKNITKDKDVVSHTCKKCGEAYSTKALLKRHYKMYHKQNVTCRLCDVVCNNITEFNLHHSSTHSMQSKKESSSDSDGIEIIEID